MRKRRGRPRGRMTQFMPIGALYDEALEMLDSRGDLGADVRSLELATSSNQFAIRRAEWIF